MKEQPIILVRVTDGVGIDRKLNGYALDGTPLKRRCYNGRICYLYGSKLIGLNTLRNSAPVEIKLENECPF